MNHPVAPSLPASPAVSAATTPNDFGDKLAYEWPRWGDAIRQNHLIVQ